jgi:quercetin dioxygenase-like cupin family protein
VQRALSIISIVAFCVLVAVSSRVFSQVQKAETPAMQAQESKTPMMIAFADLKFIDLPERKGHQYALLSGDPKTGAYTQVRKVPAGTDNELHSHSSEITNVVLKGVWYTGMDANSAKDFGPGSVVMMPANWIHVSGCRRGSECVLYQHSNGRFDFKPVAATGSEMKPQ